MTYTRVESAHVSVPNTRYEVPCKITVTEIEAVPRVPTGVKDALAHQTFPSRGGLFLIYPFRLDPMFPRDKTIGDVSVC